MPIWLIPPHPQREAMKYAAQLLAQLIGRSSRFVESSSDSTVVYYGPEAHVPNGAQAIIPMDEYFWSRLDSGSDISPQGVAEWRNAMYPRWAETGVSRKQMTSGGRICPVDPIAATFFLVSRIEELRSRAVDVHGRFPAEQAWMVRMGLIERPLVHEYARALAEFLGLLDTVTPVGALWPNGHKFALAFTHDIDRLRMHGSLWRDLRGGLGQFRTRGGLRSGRRRVRSCYQTRLLRKQDPYDTFGRILEEHSRHGFRSTWFWISTKPSLRNADYHPTESSPAALIARVRDTGHEIGLHGSYESADHPNLLFAELQTLESVAACPIVATRQHYLRFQPGKTWHGQRAAGLTVDSTLGFAGRLGFRAGIAAPFRPWDFVNNRPHDLWEVPLAIMDVTAHDYMRLDPNEAISRSQALIDKVATFGGAVALLWHNSSLNEIDWPGWSRVYDSWLDRASAANAWCGTASEIARQWQSRCNGLNRL